MADRLWSELRAAHSRPWPRYGTTIERCPSCGLAPTLLVPIASVVWASCEACETRFETSLRPEPIRDADGVELVLPADLLEGILFENMKFLAHCHDLSTNETRTPMMSAPQDQPTDFDPWPTAKHGDADTSPTAPPDWWPGLPQNGRGRLAALVIRASAGGDFSQSARQRVFDALRAQATAGDGTASFLLERIKSRFQSSSEPIDALLLKFKRAGGALELLKQRRAELDREISALESFIAQG